MPPPRPFLPCSEGQLLGGPELTPLSIDYHQRIMLLHDINALTIVSPGKGTSYGTRDFHPWISFSFRYLNDAPSGSSSATHHISLRIRCSKRYGFRFMPRPSLRSQATPESLNCWSQLKLRVLSATFTNPVSSDLSCLLTGHLPLTQNPATSILPLPLP